jgi:ribosomal peptide maturation radical SAM protein 1
VLTRREDVWLPYESSRGCWWGQKHHCTFCGLNDETIGFRAKSADRVLAELRHLASRHASNLVSAVDYIMPYRYFRDLIPRLGREVPGLHMFYMQKANLSLANVVALKEAGVGVIQPGIEALSTALLRRMDKGVSAPQNLALLRYARAAGLSLNWNLLYGLPGDELAEYEQTLQLPPLLHHLHPPLGLSRLVIDRFSSYFTDPARYGLSALRPWGSYGSLLPDHADVAKLAYHFDADYRSASLEQPEVLLRVHDAVEAWRAAWESDGPVPALEVSRLTDEQFLVLDTRGLPNTREIQFITRDQASLVLAGTAGGRSGQADWALERRLAVELDGEIVPLATADPALIDEFASEVRQRR